MWEQINFETTPSPKPPGEFGPQNLRPLLGTVSTEIVHRINDTTALSH